MKDWHRHEIHVRDRTPRRNDSRPRAPARELDAVAERAHYDPRAIEGIVTRMAFARGITI